jgi:hypothetical protein
MILLNLINNKETNKKMENGEKNKKKELVIKKKVYREII